MVGDSFYVKKVKLSVLLYGFVSFIFIETTLFSHWSSGQLGERQVFSGGSSGLTFQTPLTIPPIKTMPCL